MIPMEVVLTALTTSTGTAGITSATEHVMVRASFGVRTGLETGFQITGLTGTTTSHHRVLSDCRHAGMRCRWDWVAGVMLLPPGTPLRSSPMPSPLAMGHMACKEWENSLEVTDHEGEIGIGAEV